MQWVIIRYIPHKKFILISLYTDKKPEKQNPTYTYQKIWIKSDYGVSFFFIYSFF